MMMKLQVCLGWSCGPVIVDFGVIKVKFFHLSCTSKESLKCKFVLYFLLCISIVIYDGQKTDKNVYVTLCRVCWWSSSCKLIRLCPMRRGREPSIP